MFSAQVGDGLFMDEARQVWGHSLLYQQPFAFLQRDNVNEYQHSVDFFQQAFDEGVWIIKIKGK
jgi:hypothetical protein